MTADATCSWYRHYRRIEDIVVFHVDLSPNATRESKAYSLLDSVEQARWSRFENKRPKREFAFVRAALRTILCGRLGCSSCQLELKMMDYGKPFALGAVQGRRSALMSATAAITV